MASFFQILDCSTFYKCSIFRIIIVFRKADGKLITRLLMLTFIWKIKWMCMYYFLGLDAPTVSTSSHSKKCSSNVCVIYTTLLWIQSDRRRTFYRSTVSKPSSIFSSKTFLIFFFKLLPWILREHLICIPKSHFRST